MKNKIKKILVLSIIATLFSCKKNNEVALPTQAELVKTEIENWKNELLINGEIGQQCQTDTETWIAKNPECYYGLPNQINHKIFDANNDKIQDYLLYFPAGNCCTGGHEEGSDFVKLVCSNGKNFLNNSNLREKIALKIEDAYFRQTDNDVQRAIFTITNFDTEITGNYQLWTLEDPDCCFSNEGNFKYNPFTFKIEIWNKVVKN